MTLEGTIKVIKPTQQVSASFSKREFVIETIENYPQTIQLELHQDKTDLIDVYAEGESVICHINIRGKVWQSPTGEEKYFNTLVCWRIEKVQKPGVAANTLNSNDEYKVDNPTTGKSEQFEPSVNFNEEEHSDLPF
jgi:hypothetical protein